MALQEKADLAQVSTCTGTEISTQYGTAAGVKSQPTQAFWE